MSACSLCRQWCLVLPSTRSEHVPPFSGFRTRPSSITVTLNESHTRTEKPRKLRARSFSLLEMGSQNLWVLLENHVLGFHRPDRDRVLGVPPTSWVYPMYQTPWLPGQGWGQGCTEHSSPNWCPSPYFKVIR